MCHFANLGHKPKSGYILAGAGFVKMAGFWPVTEPKSGTAIHPTFHKLSLPE